MGLSIDFTGKKVLVTGAGRGLGKSVALTFADCGADVYIGNRKEDQGLQTVKEIEAMGCKAGFTKCDVARRMSRSSLPMPPHSLAGGSTSLRTSPALSLCRT